MDDIDVVLSSSLKRIAMPGDAAGVADAIRARVDAGDTGTPASSSGFGGGTLSWLPWVGLVVVAGLVGGSLAPLGLLGAGITEVVAAETATLREHSPTYLCVEGAEATHLAGGERVLAVARNEEATWLGVRDPLYAASVLWIPASSVVVDDGQDASALPIDGDCPAVETALAAPLPPVVPQPQPAPPPAPGPSDTTRPVVGQAYADPSVFYNSEATVVHAFATDDVAVVSVLIAWSGAHTGSGTMSKVGSEWRFTFSTTDYPNGAMTFELRAVDAAGNVSVPATVVAYHEYFG